MPSKEEIRGLLESFVPDKGYAHVLNVGSGFGEEAQALDEHFTHARILHVNCMPHLIENNASDYAGLLADVSRDVLPSCDVLVARNAQVRNDWVFFFSHMAYTHYALLTFASGSEFDLALSLCTSPVLYKGKNPVPMTYQRAGHWDHHSRDVLVMLLGR